MKKHRCFRWKLASVRWRGELRRRGHHKRPTQNATGAAGQCQQPVTSSQFWAEMREGSEPRSWDLEVRSQHQSLSLAGHSETRPHTSLITSFPSADGGGNTFLLGQL